VGGGQFKVHSSQVVMTSSHFMFNITGLALLLNIMLVRNDIWM
jgi:hypothetical protein